MKESTAALLDLAKVQMQTAGEPDLLCISGATNRPYSPFNQCLLATQYGAKSPAAVPVHIEREGVDLGNILVAPLYTFSQAKERGWKIKKGAKAMLIVYGGHDAVGRVKVDGDDVRIEKSEKSDYSPRFFHVFALEDIERPEVTK